jgi:hypothetical protein
MIVHIGTDQVEAAMVSVSTPDRIRFGASSTIVDDEISLVLWSVETQYIKLMLDRNATCSEMKEQIEVAIIQHLIGGK